MRYEYVRTLQQQQNCISTLEIVYCSEHDSQRFLSICSLECTNYAVLQILPSERSGLLHNTNIYNKPQQFSYKN